ncbi:class I SAM-dependent methyltransferase [Pseudanabaena sp. FACHB-2040]|uniref:class I SAM-dependent methyltransferase n=1 Tax=Pseudanabaena sp. FACHB-2040 TaxID=2692859 RepID=UPI001687302A|nr:class I SAM-dependent methyltransferase [Pseudanabaena sp. FACHB-2040]MBD2260796.1 methyltransferase domain-containing protein [Pseudanabaena sp. FACHB-2040]
MSNRTKAWSRWISGAASSSFLFNGARAIWEKNKSNGQLHLSKSQKALVGAYLVLNDFAEGKFPPTFEDQQKLYEDEIDFTLMWPGLSAEESFEVAQSKPFWFGRWGIQYLSDFLEITRYLEKLGLNPPKKLVEIGCGTGWLSEFLAIMGFEVIGTTLSPYDITAANCRVESLKTKGIHKQLNFCQAPMETVDKSLKAEDLATFDGVFVYEALHHAYSWQETIQACFRCLKPGGWLLICAEPNLMHTVISYRVSILTKTHEIGFNRRMLIAYLKKTGFSKHKILKNQFAFGVKSIWLAAQK